MNGNNLVGLMRAIRGPLILITVGTLFAVDHAGGYGFSRTWPVLIIVYGVLKLLERAVGRAEFQNPATGGTSS
jgi:hypothetical protein